MSDQLVMGAELRDVVSGFTGIATGICEHISGTTRFLLTGKSIDGAIPLCEGFDSQTLDWVNDGVQSRATPIAEKTPFALGCTVKSLVTNKNGMVISRWESFNGCVNYEVYVAPTDGKHLPEAACCDFIHSSLLEWVDDGISKTIEPTDTGPIPGVVRNLPKQRIPRM